MITLLKIHAKTQKPQDLNNNDKNKHKIINYEEISMDEKDENEDSFIDESSC